MDSFASFYPLANLSSANMIRRVDGGGLHYTTSTVLIRWIPQFLMMGSAHTTRFVIVTGAATAPLVSNLKGEESIIVL